MAACEPRFYRDWSQDRDLVSFTVEVKESDLYIRAASDLSREAMGVLIAARDSLEAYIRRQPEFLTALEPLKLLSDAPPIVKTMAEAAEQAGVGPMAAVAGAIAECVGEELTGLSPEVMVENGGDLFLSLRTTRRIGVYAGEFSPFSGRLALQVEPGETPLGICTSAGTVGHSLSFGRCDAAILISPSTPLADAAATAVGNVVQTVDDIQRGIDLAMRTKGVTGVVIIKDGRIGAWGRVRLVDLGVEE